MSISEYSILANEAGKSEREERWKDAYDLWRLAQKEIGFEYANYAWAETRALFCLKRMKHQ